MITHAGGSFDDSPLRPYRLSKRLVHNHYDDECEIFMVYGTPQGIGKTGYVNHVLADLHGYLKCKDEELVRAMWVKPEQATSMPKWESDWKTAETLNFYPPDEVVDKCLYMLDHDIVDVAFHWDDAGTWLYVMEYHDPFVIAFMEYLGLARSNWKGGIILSTPFKEWILRKLQTAEGILQIKITKPAGTDRRYIWKPRKATCYKKVRYPGSTRAYWPRQFIDRFIAIMPDSFYEWYEPRRNKYAKLVAVKMKLAVQKRKTRGWDVSKAEEVLEQMEKHIGRANDKAQDLREAISQNTPLAR